MPELSVRDRISVAKTGVDILEARDINNMLEVTGCPMDQSNLKG